MDVRVGLWRRLSAKNWCFWTVVLEKTLESPLDCKEIQPVHFKGDGSWVFFGRNDAKAETPVVWPPHVKSWLIGKDSDAGRDWGQEEKGTTEDEMAEWPHWLDGREFEWTPGDGDGQGGLVCCDSWGRRVRHDWATELNWTDSFYFMYAYVSLHALYLLIGWQISCIYHVGCWIFLCSSNVLTFVLKYIEVIWKQFDPLRFAFSFLWQDQSQLYSRTNFLHHWI